LISITGTGLGGGGGRAKGQLEEVFVDGGHALALYKPTESAKTISNWLGGSFWSGWLAAEEERQREAPIDPLISRQALWRG